MGTSRGVQRCPQLEKTTYLTLTRRAPPRFWQNSRSPDARALMSRDTFNARRTLVVDGDEYDYFSLPDAARNGAGDSERLPVSLKVLLENLLRFEDGSTVGAETCARSVAGRTHRRKQRKSPTGRRGC